MGSGKTTVGRLISERTGMPLLDMDAIIEEREGKLEGYEIKWTAKRKAKAPTLWLETYPQATYQVITPENYLDFIT